MFKIIATFCLFAFLSSCSFNNAFYKPDTNKVSTPPESYSNYIKYTKNDSIHSLFFEKEKPIASILLLHGNAGNLSSWSEVADLFYQAGYQVLIIDYPGYGNSSNTANHENVLKSTQAAVDYFQTLPNVNANKKLILGYSLGGNLAIKMGHDNPDAFDAMAIEGAFESHKSIAKYQKNRPVKGLAKMLTKNIVDGKELIATWDKPLLVIHSTKDRVCPYEMGENLYNAAIKTQQKELWTVSGPHLAGLSLNIELYLAKIETLVNKELPN